MALDALPAGSGSERDSEFFSTSGMHGVSRRSANMAIANIRKSSMSLNDALTQLIESPKPRALVLQGTWGRGKTHLWKMIWADYADRYQKQGNKLTRYAYVSLFGISSLDELRQAIFESNEELLVHQDPAIDDESFIERTKKYLTKNTSSAKKFGGVLANSAGISGGGVSSSLGNAYRVFSFSRVRNMLICLDDIERRGDGLRLMDVLGLVSFLWEQRGCRVLLIMNKKSFGQEDELTWEKNKEKVFQQELSFSPSSEECVEIIFRGEQEGVLRSVAKKSLIDLKVTNIRIVERVRSFLEQVDIAVEGIHVANETQFEISRCLVLAVYCHSGRGEGAPSVEYVIRKNIYGGMFRSKEKDDRSEEERLWDEDLEAYSYYIDSDLDSFIVDTVQQGYLDIKNFVDAIRSANSNISDRLLLEKYRTGWNLWHGWFSDNKDEMVKAFRDSFPDVAGSISAINADGTIRLMREIGENTLADYFVRVWVDARRGDRIEELSFKLLNQRGQEITDHGLLQEAASVFSKERVLLSLSAAMSRLSEGEGHFPEVAEAVAGVDVTEFVDYLLSNPGDKTHIAVKACLALEGYQRDRNYDLAARKAKDAIRLIAAISPFNDFRMRKQYAEVMHEEHGQQVNGDG